MAPTLEVGDRLMVYKLAFRIGQVDRGDLVVFNRPAALQQSELKDFVKRVVALPGEEIQATHWQSKLFCSFRPLNFWACSSACTGGTARGRVNYRRSRLPLALRTKDFCWCKRPPLKSSLQLQSFWFAHFLPSQPSAVWSGFDGSYSGATTCY